MKDVKVKAYQKSYRWKSKYEIVKQYNGIGEFYFTIFGKHNNVVSDDDGNPLHFDDYYEANEYMLENLEIYKK